MSKLTSILGRLGAHSPLLKSESGGAAPGSLLLSEAVRFPYGPFRFKANLAKGARFAVEVCTDLRTWTLLTEGTVQGDSFEFLDTEAAKYSYRFYRLKCGESRSLNVLGYVSTTVPPGFAMIANPFDNSAPVGEALKGWPDGTTLNRFDTRLFRLGENAVKHGKWTNPGERLPPGEGAIFYNPTSDYKSLSFCGEVMQGNLSVPIPSGFSIRSSIVPLPGNLVSDMDFPIANGDVVHVFDRDQQKYVLYPFENGQWTAGEPLIGVAESFWVAKADPGNWVRHFTIES